MPTRSMATRNISKANSKIHSKEKMRRKHVNRSPLERKLSKTQLETPNNYKITTYFSPSPKELSSKDSKEEKPHITVSKTLFKTNKNMMKSIIDKENCQGNKKLNKSSSRSFKKYGANVPSYEDILQERREYENYKAQVEDLSELVFDFPELEAFSSASEDETFTLDCKSMSDDEIVSVFSDNLPYLNDIYSGKIYCKRHEMYKKLIHRQKLIYNTSMILFKNEHKQLLSSLLCETFGDSTKSSDYYFKVLLPELCLKIFMDKFCMTYKEAHKYLDERPVNM